MRSPAFIERSVCETPSSLLKFPFVAQKASPKASFRMAASICVVVVLPLLPTTASTGPSNLRRRCAANSMYAQRVSGTTSCGMSTGVSRSTTAATAPASRTADKKSCASKRSPRRATKTEPGVTRRESVTSGADAKSVCHFSPAAFSAASVFLRSSQFIGGLPREGGCGAPQTLPERLPRRRRDGARR